MKCMKDNMTIIFAWYQMLCSQTKGILFFQKNVKCLFQHMAVESTWLKSAGESLLQSEM